MFLILTRFVLWSTWRVYELVLFLTHLFCETGWEANRTMTGGNEEERGKARQRRREIVILMTAVISLPLGIDSKHYAVSILTCLYPEYKLLDPIIILLMCVWF